MLGAVSLRASGLKARGGAVWTSLSAVVGASASNARLCGGCTAEGSYRSSTTLLTRSASTSAAPSDTGAQEGEMQVLFRRSGSLVWDYGVPVAVGQAAVGVSAGALLAFTPELIKAPEMHVATRCAVCAALLLAPTLAAVSVVEEKRRRLVEVNLLNNQVLQLVTHRTLTNARRRECFLLPSVSVHHSGVEDVARRGEGVVNLIVETVPGSRRLLYLLDVDGAEIFNSEALLQLVQNEETKAPTAWRQEQLMLERKKRMASVPRR